MFGSSIIVAGGCDRWAVTNKVLSFNQNQSITQVYLYDTLVDKWTSLPPLSVARRGCTAAILGDRWLYVIGGSDGQGTLNTVEVL